MAEYDVAISFAGEDRDTAQKLANELHNQYDLAVFYDDYEQAKLIGKNLTEYLIDIYKNRASYCVVLVSKHYKEKRWTRHEWRAAQARAFEEPDGDYILPVRLDETELPGLLPTVGHLSLEKFGWKKTAQLIYEKVADLSHLNNALRLAQSYYAEQRFNDALQLVIKPEFDGNVEALRIRADVFGKKSEYQDAIQCLHKILALIQDDFLANFLLGIFYYRIRDYKNSVRYFEVADKLSPGHPTIMTDLPAARRRLWLQRLPVVGIFFGNKK